MVVSMLSERLLWRAPGFLDGSYQASRCMPCRSGMEANGFCWRPANICFSLRIDTVGFSAALMRQITQELAAIDPGGVN